MTQWPNVQSNDNDKTNGRGKVVPGTAIALPLSNEQVIRRVEQTAAGSLVESVLTGNHLDEVIVSSFVEDYLHPLALATQEQVARGSNGTLILPRRTIQVNDLYVNAISYGYNPAEVAFALKQLSDLLTKASQGSDRKLRLTDDMLFGFSCVLGWYNLARYLLQLEEESGKKDALWLQRFYDLTVSSSMLETGMDKAKSWLASHLPPHSATAPDMPCWYIANGSGGYANSEAASILPAEKNRLLAFRNSLYMYLSVLSARQNGQKGGST